MSFLTTISVTRDESFVKTSARFMFLFPVIGALIGFFAGLYSFFTYNFLSFLFGFLNVTFFFWFSKYTLCLSNESACKHYDPRFSARSHRASTCRRFG